MSKAHPPELKRYMDKRLTLKLNGHRQVQGILRGFDPFMNLVMDEAVELASTGEHNNIGMVSEVSSCDQFQSIAPKALQQKIMTQWILVIRGNSVVLMEALDRV